MNTIQISALRFPVTVQGGESGSTVIPVILTVYFEIFGQAVLYRLKKNPVLGWQRIC